ncbi:phytanoyl-CoA dioxygenase family protein [Cryphonectria parasitica EP155]|uniref:Phytanoyl-CoA dioxygenase family protein n=1 Tax=Cryphonectria parasitica (strain ATCC 38755 / EP155) TaxID=660469 RepID=A0A9P4XZB8_CRYP1|nr:phytanoyl-CoA dioxygenase family protein [Cryphonectria parasitica EP155]KAF3763305.1 phytanoyl-CoA dioxygenase family protein [Cryphonectria parasitica EP155]
MNGQIDAPQAIAPTEKERQAGVYSPRNLQKVLGALHRDGLVVLRDVIDKDHIDALNDNMCKEAERMMSDPNQAYNQNVKSNFLQRPPVTDAAHLHEDIYFNSFLLQIANAYLGSKPIWNWLTSNTALANTAGMRQPEHKDSNFDHPLCPYYFIANIPLCDFSVENGATEFWLGSSVYTTMEDQQTEARRAVRPPLQPEAHRGDIMIRDLRTWHAGMPNNSDKHRIMLGLGYQSPFHPNFKQRLHLPLSQEEFFLGQSKGRIEVRANFYDDDEFSKTKADTMFDICPQYGSDE